MSGMNRVCVLSVVGLNRELLAHAPAMQRYAARSEVHRLRPPFPAVTCTSQSTMLTGLAPTGHGIVGNGWYDRESAEVRFWKQSNHLVGGEKIWEAARRRDSRFTCAQLFWWFNMYSSADFAVTPRPMYPADGRKIPDVHAHPPELRTSLQHELGAFPLFEFWGPAASIRSSRWIADCYHRIERRHEPTLSLVYLPHLDYPLQKLGPGHAGIPEAVREIDAVVEEMLDHNQRHDIRTLIVSEYGIEPVDRPIMINRELRKAGFITVREELGRELLDAGACRAFAVVDHQAAHVYVRSGSDRAAVAELCRATPGVEHVWDRDAQAALGLAHPRGGDLVLAAAAGAWFSYPYWLDDARAPDFARTVDIHRKPGYDPCELFIDPAIRWPKARIAWRLLQKKLGFRALLDVIPLDATLVRGSHGRTDMPEALDPLLISGEMPIDADPAKPIHMAAVREIVLQTIFGKL